MIKSEKEVDHYVILKSSDLSCYCRKKKRLIKPLCKTHPIGYKRNMYLKTTPFGVNIIIATCNYTLKGVYCYYLFLKE